MTNVVFLTRGHGYGHAARDLQILERLQARPGVQVTLASSGTGLEYYRARGVPCRALDIPDDDDMSERAGKQVWSFLAEVGPVDLVVADEVMWAPPVCRKLLGSACVVVTDWFYREWGMPHLDRLLDQAAAVVVPDFPATHPDPPDLAAPVHFTGPLARRFATDREAARRDLGLEDSAFAAVLTLGGMPQRPRAAAIAELVLAAWSARAGERDRLFVLADPPPGAGHDSGHGRAVSWVGVTATPERFFRAADLVVAEATGFTVCELARNLIPAVAVANPARLGLAPMARLRVELLESAGLVHPTDLAAGPEALWAQVERARSGSPNGAPTVRWGDPDEVASLLLTYAKPNGAVGAAPPAASAGAAASAAFAAFAAPVRWSVRWENELGERDHAQIADLLRRSYPDPALFEGSRSWAGARPELRIAGWSGDRLVAHIAALRRFVRAGGRDQLVGEPGLAAVHPDWRGRGLGRELVRRFNQVLERLELPFGFLNCRKDLVDFYAAAGWVHLPGVLTRHIDVHTPLRASTLDYPAMVLPVTAPLDQWPPGPLIDRNGWET